MEHPQGYSSEAIAHAALEEAGYGMFKGAAAKRVSELTVEWWAMRGHRQAPLVTQATATKMAKGYVRENYGSITAILTLLLPIIIQFIVPLIVNWLFKNPQWAAKVAANNRSTA